ncbi:MAG: acyltransferase [Saprospiraceae bacterium]|nr:acyltransferase [Saprospiraceae bacterium]
MLKSIYDIMCRIPTSIFYRLIVRLPFFHFIKNTQSTQTPITHKYWIHQKVFRNNSNLYWPIHRTSTFSGDWKNVYCGIETCPGYSPGNYIQAIGKLYIGDYTQIAPNVGIITGNHDIYDNSKHIISEVKIGSYCWVGMGAIILPGVVLGDFTVVAAGAIVTKSFKEGYCVIGGNPAKKIKDLNPEQCVRQRSKYEYNGYIRAGEFEEFRKKNLNL